MDSILGELRRMRCDIGKLHKLFNENYVCEEVVKERKGSICSVNGQQYENLCYENIKHSSKIVKQGGGSSHNPDIYTQNGHIECKPGNSPDWGQSTLKWKEGLWVPTNELFQKYMDRVIFKPPPFLTNKDMTHAEWLENKRDYKDVYLSVGDHEIQNFYRNKGCAYIQIKGFGLYHLGEDTLELGVPEFKVDQEIRIRAKIHSKTKSQFSVTAAFQPLDIRTLKPSEYSLDDRTRLPPNL